LQAPIVPRHSQSLFFRLAADFHSYFLLHGVARLLQNGISANVLAAFCDTAICGSAPSTFAARAWMELARNMDFV
jgi:hypothetical protein